MLSNVGLFLLQMLFDCYIYVLVLRFLLQTLHADYFNPLSQFALRLTQWLIKPLQKFIPTIKDIDLAVLLPLFVLEFLKYELVLGLHFQAFPSFSGTLLITLTSILGKFVTFYFYAIIIRVVLSWMAPVHHNPVAFAMVQLTEPLLKPIRRLIPLLGGFDLSPLVLLILLQILQFIVINPLTQVGIGFTVSS